MDWANVTGRELWDALREVELKAPRAAWEFLSSFTIPKNQTKWTSRLKCNAYYYISNYLLLLAVAQLLLLIRHPVALGGSAAALLALLSVNDPFASGINEFVIRGLRKVHAPTASLLRAAIGNHGSSGSLGVPGSTRRSKGVTILLLRRPLFIALALALALYCWWHSHAWLALGAAVLIGTGAPLLHATFRSPNLKARLASAREEFRAVWRGYQTDLSNHDYTL